MAHRVLSVFCGQPHDYQMFSDFAGLAKFYIGDVGSDVTALASHYPKMGPEEKDLLCVSTLSKFGRGSVYSYKESIQEEQFFRILPKQDLKRTVLDWIKGTSELLSEGGVMTVNLHAHGEYVRGNLVMPCGDYLSVDEVMNCLKDLSDRTQVNIHNFACYSGWWVILASTDVRISSKNVWIHSSSQRDEIACMMRSVSGALRCGQFTAALLDSFKQTGTMTDHSDRVYSFMSRIPFPDGLSTPATHLVPDSNWIAPFRIILGLVYSAVSVPVVLIAKAVDSIGNLTTWLFGITRRPPSYSAVRDAVSERRAYDFQEATVHELGRRYLCQELTKAKTDILKQVLVQRRLMQFWLVGMVKEGVRRGVFPIDALISEGWDWVKLPKDVSTNFNLLGSLLPGLVYCETNDSESQGRFTCRLPRIWLAYIISRSRSISPLFAAMKDFRRLVIDAGFFVAAVSGTCRQFRGWNCAEGSTSRCLPMFDCHLPTTIEEFKSWDAGTAELSCIMEL